MKSIIHLYTHDPAHWFGLIWLFVYLWRRKLLSTWMHVAMLTVLLDLITDIIAIVVGHIYHNNNGVYSISNSILFCVTYIIYSHMLNLRMLKKTLLWFIVAYLFICIGDLFFIQGWKTLNTYAYFPGAMAIAWLSFTYMKQCVEDIDIPLLPNIFFWFSIANLLYYVGSISVVSTIPMLAASSSKVWNMVYPINTALHCAWYIIITLGFIWKKI